MRRRHLHPDPRLALRNHRIREPDHINALLEHLLREAAGEGRVAQLLSDHAWLWARGFEGGGPQSLLLRRLVHWLMREPELEEEQLLARAAGQGLAIERRSLSQEPAEITVTARRMTREVKSGASAESAWPSA